MIRPLLVSIAALLLAGGCRGGLGPQSVRLTRTDYNVAAQETGAQELLLNLVRLRYRDTPYFLQIASLSTNMRAAVGIGGEGTFLTPGADAGKLLGTLAIEESPTVTYTPVVGERFVKEMLEPVEPEILLLLSHAGWSIDRFFRLLVQEVNGIPNAPSASGPTPDRAPIYQEFLRVSELLRILQMRRELALIQGTMEDERGGVWLRFTPEGLASDEYRELAARLGLEPGRQLFELVASVGPRSPGRIQVVLRSVLSALFYASHGIAVPEEDRAAGRVTTTLDASGAPFDWGRLTGSLLRVRAGRPDERPYVSVRYRDRTFFIDDADRDSKSTFAMIHLVLALKAGNVPTSGPVLTLPVMR
ncbi:MAG: hypothetical protein R3F35_23890 [Myxococcota bacterium]